MADPWAGISSKTPLTGRITPGPLEKAKTPVAAKPKPGIGSRAKTDLFTILGALPEFFLKGGLVKEALKAIWVVPPEGDLAKLVEGYTGEKPLRAQLEEMKKLPTARQRFHAGTRLPGYRFLPGTFAAEKLLEPGGIEHPLEHLTEHPVMTLLDVLPIAGKIGKQATAGSKLAVEAAETSAKLGQPARAARMIKGGLTFPEMGTAFARRAEKAALRKYPGLEGRTPSAVWGKFGLGQEIRSAVRPVGPAQREVQSRVGLYAKQKEALAKRLGMSPEREAELFEASQRGQPGWEQMLGVTQNERDFIQAMQDDIGQYLAEDMAAGHLFRFKGEVWSRADAPRLGRTLDEIGRAKMRMADPVYIGRLVEKASKIENRTIRLADRIEKEALRKAAILERQALSLERKVPKVVTPTVRTTLRGERITGDVLKADPYIARRVEQEAFRQQARALRQQAEEMVERAGTEGATVRRGGMSDAEMVLLEEQKKIGNLTFQAERSAARIAPARWKAALQPELEYAVRKSLPDADEAARRAISQRDYVDAFAGNPKDLQRVGASIQKMWQTFRDWGFEPMWWHHVSPDDLARLNTARLIPGKILTKPSAVKARSFTQMGVAVPSMQVAVAEQVYESVLRQASQHLVEQTWPKLGVLLTQEQIAAERNAMRVQGLSRVAIDKRIANKYTLFDPDSVFPFQRTRPQVQKGQWYMPKHAARAVRSMGEQMAPGGWRSITSAPAGLLRLSVLDLNPLYYAGNASSGMVMTLLRRGPRTLAKLPEAFRRLRADDLPYDLTRSVSRMDIAEREAFGFEYGVGRAVADLMEKSDPAMVTRAGKQVWSGALKGRRGLQKFAAWIDDMYKTAAYLDELERATKAGVTEADAIARGVEAAHKILVDMDRLTPVERALVRQFMPFYSWSQHILRFTFSLPFDHPVRVAFLAAYSRTLEDDLPEGLPDRFKTMLFIGDKAIRTSDAFPMNAVPNYFGSAGILGRLNPAIQTAAEYFGLDPWTWSPDKFYDKRWGQRVDPVSGQIVANQPPLWRVFTVGVLPQMETLLEWLSPSPEMIEFKQRNPEAYLARMYSNFGIPVPREYDLGEEVKKVKEREERVGRLETTRLWNERFLRGEPPLDGMPEIKWRERKLKAQAQEEGVIFQESVDSEKQTRSKSPWAGISSG